MKSSRFALTRNIRVRNGQKVHQKLTVHSLSFCVATGNEMCRVSILSWEKGMDTLMICSLNKKKKTLEAAKVSFSRNFFLISHGYGVGFLQIMFQSVH